MQKAEKGQSLVEFALVLMFAFLPVMAICIDAFPLIANEKFAEQMSVRGARAASIYYPDGVHNCYQSVVDAIGHPGLISAEWTLEVSDNCTANPTDSLDSGEAVDVTVHVVYSPLFLGGVGYPPRDTTRTFAFARTTQDNAR